MKEPSLPLLWTQLKWIEAAHAWIRQSLTSSGYKLTGPIDQFHTRIWSTVMRCPTDTGLLYFKACQRLAEPHLTLFLSRIQPENMPDLVALDLDRGWMLMRDAGPMLRAYIKSPQDLGILEPALIQFANLQISVAQQPEQFFALGAQDHRLERLPDLFETMLSDEKILRLGAEDGLTQTQFQQLRATLPRYIEMCQQLRACAIPQTLFHDDFHDGNIFVSETAGQTRFVFSDWDESCVGHPFFSIMLCLRSVGGSAGFPDEATEAPDRMPADLNHLRDIYLHPWQRYESPERLIEIFNLAWRVGMVSRALTWREFVSSLDEPARAEFAYFVPAWLQEYLLAMK